MNSRCGRICWATSSERMTGTSIIVLANGSLLPGGSSTFSIDVQIPQSAPTGDHTNTTSPLIVDGLPEAPPATAVAATTEGRRWRTLEEDDTRRCKWRCVGTPISGHKVS